MLPSRVWTSKTRPVYRRGGQTHFVLFDDAGTLKRKMEMGQVLGIREGFVMLPEVEDLTQFLFTGEG